MTVLYAFFEYNSSYFLNLTQKIKEHNGTRPTKPKFCSINSKHSSGLLQYSYTQNTTSTSSLSPFHSIKAEESTSLLGCSDFMLSTHASTNNECTEMTIQWTLRPPQPVPTYGHICTSREAQFCGMQSLSHPVYRKKERANSPRNQLFKRQYPLLCSIIHGCFTPLKNVKVSKAKAIFFLKKKNNTNFHLLTVCSVWDVNDGTSAKLKCKVPWQTHS